MTLSLHGIANALGGKVRGHGRYRHVAARAPGAKKRSDESLHVFINGDDIGVHLFRDGLDPILVKDYVRARCGLPAWQPKRKYKPLPSLSERNQYLTESLRIARHRKRITLEQFALLINDLKNASPGVNLKPGRRFMPRSSISPVPN